MEGKTGHIINTPPLHPFQYLRFHSEVCFESLNQQSAMLCFDALKKTAVWLYLCCHTTTWLKFKDSPNGKQFLCSTVLKIFNIHLFLSFKRCSVPLKSRLAVRRNAKLHCFVACIVEGNLCIGRNAFCVLINMRRKRVGV